MIRSRTGDYLRQMRPLDPGLLLILLVAIGATIAPPAVSIVLGNSLSAVWASPGLFAFVLVAVCAAKFPVSRTETRRLAASVLALTVIAVVLLAPAHAYYRNRHPFSEGRNYYSSAAAEVMKRWRAVSSSPLKTVSGDKLAMALAFYSPDHPAFVIPFNQQYVWQTPSEAVLRDGWATICLPDEETCQVWLKHQVALAAPGAIGFDFAVQPQWWGAAGVPARITGLIVPPRTAR